MSGETVSLELLYEGPDFYCPDCRRLLVHVHDDGRFDLAAKSELVSEAHVDLEARTATALIVAATCNLRLCRLRRFLRRQRELSSGFLPVFVVWAVGSMIGASIALALRGAL